MCFCCAVPPILKPRTWAHAQTIYSLSILYWYIAISSMRPFLNLIIILISALRGTKSVNMEFALRRVQEISEFVLFQKSLNSPLCGLSSTIFTTCYGPLLSSSPRTSVWRSRNSIFTVMVNLPPGAARPPNTMTFSLLNSVVDFGNFCYFQSEFSVS